MKLTEIAIDGYKGTHNTQLKNLSSGLNVVFNSNLTVRQSISDFVLEILYGPESKIPMHTVWPNGHIQVQSGGQYYQLARPQAQQAGELRVSDLHGHAAHRTPNVLTQLEQSAYRTFFNISLNSDQLDWKNFVSQLVSRFEVSRNHSVSSQGTGNMPFTPDQAGFESWKRAADARIVRLDSIRSDIKTLQVEKDRLLAEQNEHDASYRGRLIAIENELNDLQQRHGVLQNAIAADRNRLSELDRQIQELARFIEMESSNVQHIPVSRPVTNFLAMFYERLDEVDNQIRRWRSVQSDIQDQRLRLRDEMVTNNELTIESHEHPYHDARDIALSLEHKINRTEELGQTWEQTLSPAENERQMTRLCSEMRGDLQALCSELARQYKHVRHKAVVAELKQLRRCYHEMDENVKRLLVRRESVIDEIRKLDPAGAEAILHGDQAFIVYAEQEGFLAARQRFVSGQIPETQSATEYRTIYPDLSEERSRLAELRNERVAVSDHMARLEQEYAPFESRRAGLIDERNRLQSLSATDHTLRLREIEISLSNLNSELGGLQTQVESDRHWLDWKPNYLLGEASRHLSQLTGQRLTQVWIESDHRVVVQDNTGSTFAIDQSLSRHHLSSSDQAITRLSLSLAAIEQFALRGIRLPVLIEDVQVPSQSANIGNPHLISAVDSFCRNGHQVVLLTPTRSLLDDARRTDCPIFELPDTNITPPSWAPEPSLPRHDYPVSPVPPTSQYQRRNVQEHLPELNSRDFNTIPSTPSASHPIRTGSVVVSPVDAFQPTPVVAVPRTICSRETMLQDIDLVESIYLTPMESLGIRTVGQLLDLDLDRMEIELGRRGFNLEQIDRWQAQSWLLICIPDLSTGEARVLVGSGIDQPEMLLRMEATEILQRIQQFLDSSAGRRSNINYAQFNGGRLNSWVDRLRIDNGWRTYTRSRYRRQDKAATSTTRPSPTNRRTQTPRSSKSSRNGIASSQKAVSAKKSGYQFYLNTTDDLEAAPSIGPKTAEKFYALGITSVGEFLDCDPTDVAAELSNRRMSAKVLTTWQNQSRIMCAIPNLRGHDAQILVGCNILEPSQIANMDPQELLGIVLPFVETKEGVRILRNGKKPDLAEVSEWIDAANHLRVLKAA